jgi:hypothetical protein
MKIAIYVIRYAGRYPNWKRFLIECKGTGTENDPVIIEPSMNLPQAFKIQDSDLFINIKNCNLQSLIIRSSQNIKLKSCRFKFSILNYCSKIEVENLICSKYLQVNYCTNIRIEGCNIKKLKVYQSNSNIIKNCIIAKLKSTSSNDNIYESISIPEDKLKKLEKNHFVDRIKLKSLIVFLILFFAVIIFLPKLAFNTYMELPLIFILLGVFVFLFYLVDIIKSIIENRINRTS